MKPQALRQVASELVAQFGAPWSALWDTLRQRHSPDEIEAARRLAPWLRRAHKEGMPVTTREIVRALEAQRLVPATPAASPQDAPVAVPEALRGYEVERSDLSRYEALCVARRVA